MQATEANASEAGDLIGQAVRAWESLRQGRAERERNGSEAGPNQQGAARVDGPRSEAENEKGGVEQQRDEGQKELFKQVMKAEQIRVLLRPPALDWHPDERS